MQVRLGGREYEIATQPIRKAREFRSKLTAPFVAAIAAIETAPDIDLKDGQALGRLGIALKDVVLGSVDLVVELLFEYSPELAADRERIESTATDDEALTAFVEVIKLVYPFGRLKSFLSGLVDPAILTKLPKANGEYGQTN
jgi:hypothetical protein